MYMHVKWKYWKIVHTEFSQSEYKGNPANTVVAVLCELTNWATDLTSSAPGRLQDVSRKTLPLPHISHTFPMTPHLLSAPCLHAYPPPPRHS